MGQIKQIKGKIIFKHQTAEDWEKSSYVPAVGEKVLYDPDETCSYTRVKYGDGNRAVKELPFSINLGEGSSNCSLQSDSSVAGIKAYRIQQFYMVQEDPDAKDCYISLSSATESFYPSYILYFSADLNPDNISYGVNAGWNVEDIITLTNGNTYDMQFTIQEVKFRGEKVVYRLNEVFPFEGTSVGTTDGTVYISGDSQVDFETKLNAVENKTPLSNLSFCAYNLTQPDNGVIDGGSYALALGGESEARAYGAVSFGYQNKSIGKFSLTSGRNNTAMYNSAAFGHGNIAGAEQAFAAGQNNEITKEARVASVKGIKNKVTGYASSAEGTYNTIHASVGHVEGTKNTVGIKGNNTFCAHVEGSENIVEGNNSNVHVEGKLNKGQGGGSHTEGFSNTNRSHYTHVEGGNNTADTGNTNSFSHIEGQGNAFSGGSKTHVEGTRNTVTGSAQHVEGQDNTVAGSVNHIEGTTHTILDGSYNHVEGGNHSVTGKGLYAHIEGLQNTSNTADYPHIEGRENAVGYGADGAHVEGYKNTAKTVRSHIEGEQNITEGAEKNIHVEGRNNSASGGGSHTEGHNNTNDGHFSHVEGHNNIVNYDSKNVYAHVEGCNNIVTGKYAHVSGKDNVISHNNVFVHGENLKSGNDNVTIVGQYNQPQTDTVFEVGQGTSDMLRSNILEVHKNGNVVINGDLAVNGNNISFSKDYSAGNYVEKSTNTNYATDFGNNVLVNKSFADLLFEEQVVKFPISLAASARFSRFTYNANWKNISTNTLTKMLCRFLDQITNASLIARQETNKAYFTDMPITVQFYAQDGCINVTLADGSAETRYITQKDGNYCAYALINSSQITYKQSQDSAGGEYFTDHRVWEINFTAGDIDYCMRLWQDKGSITGDTTEGPLDGTQCNVAIYERAQKTLKLGNTELTEEQLQKILFFMDSVNDTGELDV